MGTRAGRITARRARGRQEYLQTCCCQTLCSPIVREAVLTAAELVLEEPKPGFAPALSPGKGGGSSQGLPACFLPGQEARPWLRARVSSGR